MQLYIAYRFRAPFYIPRTAKIIYPRTVIRYLSLRQVNIKNTVDLIALTIETGS